MKVICKDDDRYMKIDYNTIPKKKILSKVTALTTVGKNIVKVEYNQYWNPDYVTMDKAKEFSKKFRVKIFG